MRVVYLCPFSRDQISGGIKKAYQHVEILRERGFDAEVLQPLGKPELLDTTVQPLTDAAFRPRPDDLLIFPETALVRPLLARNVPGVKVLLCSNQYFLFRDMPADKTHFDIGFDFVVCSSHAVKNFMRSVFKYEDIEIIPPFVDPTLFRPRPKKLQIAFFPRKVPYHASLIQSIFHRKYPHLRHLDWVIIDNAHEKVAAELLGESAIMLSLSHQESFGLTPIEAMAAGCLVVGFHGYGGLEYATAENGLWFWSDQLEEVADALQQMVALYEQGGERYQRRIEAGSVTAARYNRSRTADSLVGYIYKIRPQRPVV